MYLTCDKLSVTRVLCSVSNKGARHKEPEVVGPDEKESVTERVARLITQQAGAKGGSSPDSRGENRQPPRLSAKSDKSAGSDMRSGSLPKTKVKSRSFADALASPTPEEETARERVEARKRRHKTDPEELKGKDGKKKEPFIIGQSFDAIGREPISLVADTLREIGQQDVEAPTKADKTMLLPLAQKMSKHLDRCIIAVQVKQFEQSSLRDWVTPMALKWRGRNQWSAGSFEYCTTCSTMPGYFRPKWV